MSEQEQMKEIPRLYKLLLKMTEMAEHAEQTGSFESATRNLVRRYNAIVERLEDIDAVPDDLFHRLDEAADFGQLGAEAMLLADYLKDLIEEVGPPERGKEKQKRGFDPGPLIALAPFLDSGDLGRLVREHFVGAGDSQERTEARDEKKPTDYGKLQTPALRDVAELAPHLKPEELGKMARVSLANHKNFDPKALIEIAPHLRPEDLSAILHEYAPEWFGEARKQPMESEAPPNPPAPGWYNAMFPDHPQSPTPTTRAAGNQPRSADGRRNGAASGRVSTIVMNKSGL